MTMRDDPKPHQNPTTRILLYVVLASFLLGALAVFLSVVVVIRERDRQKELRLKVSENLQEISKALELYAQNAAPYPTLTTRPETRPSNLEVEPHE